MEIRGWGGSRRLKGQNEGVVQGIALACIRLEGIAVYVVLGDIGLSYLRNLQI